MRKFSAFMFLYFLFWLILMTLYKINVVYINNNLFYSISLQMLILGSSVFFMGFLFCKFFKIYNNKIINLWLLTYNSILILSIIFTAYDCILLKKDFIINLLANISYIGIGGCLLFGIYAIKEFLEVD